MLGTEMTGTEMTGTKMTSLSPKTISPVAVMTVTESAIIISVAVGVIIILLSCVKACQLRERKVFRQKVKVIKMKRHSIK